MELLLPPICISQRSQKKSLPPSQSADLWRSKRTGLRALCPDDGRTRLLSIAFDPSLLVKAEAFPVMSLLLTSIRRTFQAAVDFLSVQNDVDPDKIGIIGICGWGRHGA